MPIDIQSRIYVAGHRGMVGAAVMKQLAAEGFSNLITRTHSELELLDGAVVADFFESERPEVVVIAAARVGGIQANIDNPGRFLYENLQIQNNLIHQSYLGGVEKVCFLGSSCIYPRECPQPMKEEYLLTGPLEPTNEGYALAKIAGLKLCQYYQRQYGLKSISLMPCNLYGENDSFDLAHCHVLSALVRRFVEAENRGAESVTLWGTGSARREFLNVADLGRMIVALLQSHDSSELLNLGSGVDVSIRELAELVAGKAGYRGRIEWDATKPDGMPRKCMDVSKMHALGLEPQISLEAGVEQMIELFKQSLENKTKDSI